MSGTKEGGRKAHKKIVEYYGKEFMAKIGSKGGKRGTTGGFYHAKYVLKDDNYAREAGRKGGRISKK